MDKKRGILNIFFAISFKIIIMLLALFTRKYIVRYLGNELNGLSSLYESIVGVLCVVELGIGSAITFSMYKPIIENDKRKVNALYVLYKKMYLIVGFIILFLGVIVMFFLPKMVNSETINKYDLYFGYLSYLISIFITYLYSSKMSLIIAYKNNYVTSITTSLCQILLYVMQMFSLYIFKSFIVFNIIRIITNSIVYLILTIYVNKNHKDVIEGNNSINEEEKKEVYKNIKAMFLHKIGAKLVNTSDNIIISAFLGIEILGFYSNYATLAISLMALLNLVFTSLTSIIGHYYVSKNNDEIEKYYRFFHTINFVIGLLFFLGYFSIIDQFISIFYDNNDLSLLLEREVVVLISISFFIQYFRKATLMFKDATGTFYNDRYVPLLEGGINIILSIIFAKYFGIFGIILATIITNLFICYIFEPIILYKYAFKKESKMFMIKNYGYTLLFILSVVIFNKICVIEVDSKLLELFYSGLCSVGITLIITILVIIIDKNFRTILFRSLKRKR